MRVNFCIYHPLIIPKNRTQIFDLTQLFVLFSYFHHTTPLVILSFLNDNYYIICNNLSLAVFDYLLPFSP